jgi:hypothetical protein
MPIYIVKDFDYLCHYQPEYFIKYSGQVHLFKE